MTAAVALFIGECARLGRSKQTREKYAETLRAFCARFDKAPGDVTPDDCRAFLDRWVDAAPATLALHVSILNRFFGFLAEEELIAVNPMLRIKRPPLKRPEELEVTSVSSAEVERLYAAVRDWDERICLALLTYLGPRRSAAARLRRSDVDLERGTIRFREKGGKVIVKPVPHELTAILRAADDAGVWGGHCRGAAPPDPYVIPNRRATRNEQRSDKLVYAIVKRLGERAGVDVHPHALRAAFAVHYLEANGADTYGLQRLLGHTRPETTQVYLRRHDNFKAMENVKTLSWGVGRAAKDGPSAPNPGHSAGAPLEPEPTSPLGEHSLQHAAL